MRERARLGERGSAARELAIDNSSIPLRSDGVPQHGVASQYAVPNPGVVVPNASNSHVSSSSKVVKLRAYDFKITTKPKKAKERTSIIIGAVGMMINGALIFNPYEGDGKTVAMASNFTLTDTQGHRAAFLDKCNGHPSSGPVYAYHHHGLPKCVTKTVDRKKGPLARHRRCLGRLPDLRRPRLPRQEDQGEQAREVQRDQESDAAYSEAAKYGLNMCGPAESDRAQRTVGRTKAGEGS